MLTPEQNSYDGSKYNAGLDKIDEAVISSHFMQRFSSDRNFNLYSDEDFKKKKVIVSPEFVDQFLAVLLKASKSFSEHRATRAKLRAAEYFREYGVARPSDLNAAHFVAEFIFDRNFSRKTVKFHSRRLLADMIAQRIATGQLISLVIPALPFKLPSPLKSRGSSPDLAEVNFLLQLFEISCGIDLLYREMRPESYGPLSRFYVICDGRRFNTLVGVSDAVVGRYGERVKAWIDRLGISNFIEIVDYRGLLQTRLPPDLLAEKVAIRDTAEDTYADLMWPIFDPGQLRQSLSMSSFLEPDPEKLNPEGRFSSLFQSLMYTIRYQCLEDIASLMPGAALSNYDNLYYKLAAHFFECYSNTAPCTLEDVQYQARAGRGLSGSALEALRRAMLGEVWQATIRYMAEIKSDRELSHEPITTCFPDAIRWTIHAKRGQIAICTPTTLGISVQAWAGSAVFKRAKKNRTQLCTLPVIALEGAGAIPVIVQDAAGIFGLGDQPLFYVYPDIAEPGWNLSIGDLTDSLVRSRAA
ncbi:hypothetical protein QE385_004023 [Sphingomonas sp. SORGH_AS 950]|uniref:L-tyrosine/L-tryptophan isonitrile synthase family protein n=1 Tax=Sphingomonas sp. SORGH_AS_0950 TaxID=3041792 RepID=UPI0027814A82|nr:L-tyrosine/L-tryptophan isonitrile synthase family protein [Sphingomonas sp. SORGH_AS_0950]MDQ1159626.1 hypothetical protein [Sphingomonas sp. SORGH_AS_0950]